MVGSQYEILRMSVYLYGGGGRVGSQYEILRMCVYLYGGKWDHSMRYSECVCIYMVEGGVTV